MNSDALRLSLGLLLGFTLLATVAIPTVLFIRVALRCSAFAKALLMLSCVGACAIAAALMAFVAFPVR